MPLPVIKGKAVRPRRTILYGPHFIGKSTWAAGAPNPYFIQTESGLDDIGADRTPMMTDTKQVGEILALLGHPEEDHGYKTVVIDSLDWLERLVHASVCRDNGKECIDEIGYGKGFGFALQKWDIFLGLLEGIRARGINIVLLSHARVEKVTPPNGDPYDRWTIDIHKTAAPLLMEWADELLFVNWKIDTVTKTEEFGKKRTVAIGESARVVYTREAPTHQAGRRILLPDEMPLDWSEYQKHWPTPQPAAPAGNIAGVVVDGSSKKQKSEKEKST